VQHILYAKDFCSIYSTLFIASLGHIVATENIMIMKEIAHFGERNEGNQAVS